MDTVDVARVAVAWTDEGGATRTGELRIAAVDVPLARLLEALTAGGISPGRVDLPKTVRRRTRPADQPTPRGRAVESRERTRADA